MPEITNGNADAHMEAEAGRVWVMVGDRWTQIAVALGERFWRVAGTDEVAILPRFFNWVSNDAVEATTAVPCRLNRGGNRHH